MIIINSKNKKNNIRSRFTCSIVILAFLCNLSLPTAVFAQSTTLLNLPVPGTMVSTSEAFVPVLLKGMTLHMDDPLKFDFIVDAGDAKLDEDQLRKESDRLVKYFLASLTIPKDDLWVNLSPYEKDRIIPDALGKTDLGRDMLAEDYILKQLTASLMYPGDELGDKFWQKVRSKAKEQFGTDEIPTNTFNKVWIIPEVATVYEKGQTAFIVESRLKVMLDQDYLALQKNQSNQSLGTDQLNKSEVDDSSSVSSQIIREIIIPEIEKEVNEGKNFAKLRQIYHSLVLAKWYKETIKNTLLSQIYVDRNKTSGIETDDQKIKEKIYERYIDAFKAGVYNVIKEEYDATSQEVIPRKYFSGGLIGAVNYRKTDSAMLTDDDNERKFYSLSTRISPKATLAQLSEAWNNQGVINKIESLLGEQDLIALENAIAQNDTQGINKIIDGVNSTRFEAMAEKLKPVQTVPILQNAGDEVRRQQAIQSLENGEFVIEILSGGAATRMKDGLKALGLDLKDSEMKIWNLNIWDIISQLKERSKNQLSLGESERLNELSAKEVLTDQEKVELKSIRGKKALLDIQIPSNAKFYTAGQQSLFAIVKGIEAIGDINVQNKIRQNLKIVLHVNEDIREDVENDLRKFKFFGLKPENVIIDDGGYGNTFIIKDGQLKVEDNTNETWNHGFAQMELDWKNDDQVYTLTEAGGRRPLGESVFTYLQEKGVKHGLFRRINDGILLHPKGAFDLDFIAAYLKLAEENKADALFELVKNPTNQKGGLGLTVQEDDQKRGFLLEGVNAKSPNLQKALQSLQNVPYNRAYFLYSIQSVRDRLEENDGLPLTIKVKNGSISPEVPSGDITQIPGVRTLFGLRENDFLLDDGVIAANPDYQKGAGALIHDFKVPEDLVQSSQILKVSASDDIKEFTNKFDPWNSDSATLADQEVGGIDLNDININRQGSINLKFDEESLKPLLNMDVQGFAPIIINIKPIPNLMPFLGLEQPKTEDKLTVSALTPEFAGAY